MARKVTIQGEELVNSLEEPWGGQNDTGDAVDIHGTEVPAGSEWGLNRGEIERFIKRQFGTKVGCLYVTPRKQQDNYYHLWGFASEADRDLYLADPTEHAALRLADEAIPINEDQGTTYAARLTLLDISDPENVEPLELTNPIVAVTRQYNIGVRFCGIQNDSGEISNAGETGMLTVQRQTGNSDTWVTVGTVQLTSLNPDSTAYAVVNIGQWFSTTNPQQLRLRASFTKTDDNGEVIAAPTSAWQVLNDVTFTQLVVQNLQDWTQPIMASEGVFPLKFSVMGAVKKWLHVTISGSVSTFTHVEEIPAETEYPATSPRTWNETERAAIGMLTHGVHTVTAWLTCDDGSGHLGADGYPDGLQSATVVNRFMVVNTETHGADLTKPYLMLQQTLTTVQNYVRAVIARYAVWVPQADHPTLASETPLPISVRLTDSAENDTDYTTEYVRNEITVLSGQEYTLDTTVEIESDGSSQQQPSYLSYLRFFRYGANDTVINFLRESVSALQFVTITVDNTEDFAPVAGAWFVLSPRTRNNSETDKFTIINHQTGQTVTATFRGFGGVNDLWTEDENGQKVLRVLAGEELEIEIDPWSHFAGNPRGALTACLDYAVRNITAEDDPVIDITQVASGETLGLKMMPLDGWVKCVNRQETNDQDFGWEEGKRTHAALTIDPAVVAKADDELTWQQTLNGAPSLPLSLAKVYINGDPRREIDYSPVADTWVQGNGHTIKIGNPNADIDIYDLRFYRSALSAEQVRQNVKASLPTAEEKRAFSRRNAITTNGRIDYEKAKTAGYRLLTLVGQDQYKLNQSKDPGYACYWRIVHDKASLSGTIGKAAYLAYMNGTLGGKKCLMVTPQGSTANTYWDNNEQTKLDKVTYVVNIPFSKVHAEFGWKPAQSTGDGCANPMYLNGTRIEGTDYAGLTDEEKAQVTIDVVDGWFDGNGWSENVGEMGMYHGQCYTSYEGGPKCQKLVNKINYASPMQSHKMGATRLYHDVMQAVTGGNSLTQAGARFSVYEENFLFFTEHPQDNGKVEFRGMCTFGNGKFDKVVFGLKANSNTFGFEGLNNNLPLCDFRVPADQDVTYNPDDEAWVYNGVKSFEYGLGKTQVVDGKEYPKTVNDTVFRRYVNFIYCHNTSLKYYNGTKSAFTAAYEALTSAAGVATEEQAAATIAASTFLINATGVETTGKTAKIIATEVVAEMQKYQWWPTQGTDAYKLLRYNFVTGAWVDAGTWDQEHLTYTAGVRNLSTDPMTASAYISDQSDPNYGNWVAQNEAFIMAIANDVIANLGSVGHVQNHLTHYNMVNFMIAGTDNCSKNTYYQYDPETGLIWLDQDDLDSILATDNNGRQTKVYFLDRIHDVADYKAGYKPQIDYEGRASALFNMIEVAYETASDALRQNMRDVLTAMAGLVGANEGFDQSVMGCLDKYFFSIQEYFPEVAYAEQARLRYEWPKSFGYISFGNQARGIDPITQQVGSQLEKERQYMKRRMALVASYACWGDFSSGVHAGVVGLSDSGSSLSLSPGQGRTGGEYKFTVVPHQWLYPTGMVDRTAVDPHVRVAPGESYTFVVAQSGAISGDSSVGLAALNYYRKIGNIGDMVVGNNSLSITAQRLTELVAEPANPTAQLFAPGNIALSTPNLQRLSLKGCTTFGGSKDFSSLTRLEEMDLRGTGVINITLAPSQLLTSLRLPANMNRLVIDNLPNLETLTMEGYDALTILRIGANVGGVDTRTLTVNLHEAKVTNATSSTAAMTAIELHNVDWVDVPVSVLSWLADISTADITGTISIYEPSLSTNQVTFDVKDKLNKKWGNVDNPDHADYQGLRVVYRYRALQNATVKGNFYNDGGTTYPFGVTPDSSFANGFTKIRYSLSGLHYSQATINPVTGVLTVQSLSNLNDTATVTATITTWDGEEEGVIYVSKEIALFNREAQLGDYVYHDGTYSSVDTYDGEKTVIGVCCYVAPKYTANDPNGAYHEGDIVPDLFNPNDRMQRLMVALNNLSATGSVSSGGLSLTSFQWGNYYNNGSSAANELYDYNTNEATMSNRRLQVLDANGNVLLSRSTMYDLSKVTNISYDSSTVGLTDAIMRDETSDLGILNDGFKVYAPTNDNGEGVSAYNETSARLATRTVGDTGNNVPRNLLSDWWKTQYDNRDPNVPFVVNQGYANTLHIIEQRNIILNNGIILIPEDASIGQTEDRLGPLALPSASPGVTELESLASLMGELRNYMGEHFGETNKAKWSQIYYPAASAAYAYQPTVPSTVQLADRFKAHNWFLPTVGLLKRLAWYWKQGTTSDKNIFKKAIAGRLFVNFTSSSANFWSSSESYSYSSWYVYFASSGYSYSSSKYNSYAGRAVAAF
ncbi:MAG: hypothetical protein K6A94_00730 [Bacteroidales bacterium]|nr:hypothetical protein [Bacteroidales bacterium]